MSDEHHESSGLLTDEVIEALDKLIEPVMAGKPIEDWAEASRPTSSTGDRRRRDD